MTESFKKTDGKFVRIGNLLYVRNGRLYGMKRFGGKLYRQVAPIQGLDAVDGRNRPTTAARKWVATWASQIENDEYFQAKKLTQSEPTWRNLFIEYERAATVEYSIHGSPSPSTVNHAILSGKRVLRMVGLSDNCKVSEMTLDRMEMYIELAMAEGAKPISAFANLQHMRSLFARWTKRAYEKKGWTFDAPKFPEARGLVKSGYRYLQPPEALRNATLKWYRALEKGYPEAWVAVTLMLQFGMRNSDALLCRWDWFRRSGDLVTAAYIPHKTANSSGRTARIPVSQNLFNRLKVAAGDGERLIDDGNVFKWINLEMRKLGWTGSKASYELRKMCIDRIYREHGAEAAVQVSGDNIMTVSRYYADPSRARSVAFDW